MEISMASDVTHQPSITSPKWQQPTVATTTAADPVLDQFQQIRLMISTFLGARHDPTPSQRQSFCKYHVSAPWWWTAPWISWQVYQMSSRLPSSPWISCSWLFSPPCSVVIYCKAWPAKTSGQRHHPPAESSVDLAPQVQVVQVVVVQTFCSQLFFLVYCGWISEHQMMTLWPPRWPKGTL